MSKYIKYLKYVVKHKYYVFLECYKLGVPFRGLAHDMSKFLPSEFIYYADYFYGKKRPSRLIGYGTPVSGFHKVYTQEDLENDFDRSWLYHQHRNKHHWQYWILRHDNGKTEAVDMPDKYIKEMIADWVGAGKAIKGKDNGGYRETFNWYVSNRSKMILSERTRARVESILARNISR